MELLFDLVGKLRGTVPISKWTLVLTVFGVGLVLVNWRWVTIRTGWRSLPTLGTLLALAGTLALTLSPRGHFRGPRSTPAECLPTDVAQLDDSIARVGDSAENLLNMLMLTPLGFALVLATRRVAWPAMAMVLLPTAIELSQLGIRGRDCSPADWFANVIGGLAGVLLAVLVQRRLCAWWTRTRPMRENLVRRASGEHRPNSAPGQATDQSPGHSPDQSRGEPQCRSRMGT